MTERCEGRYSILGRSEPFDVTYRCGLHKGHTGACAAAHCGARSGDLICDRDANHEGNHRGYNEQIDEPMFWPPNGATQCEPWTAVMDFPTAWAFIKDLHSDPEEHDQCCSWVQSKRGLLCDCHIINDEYARRKEKHGNAKDASGSHHRRDHDGNQRAHQTGSFAARESSLQPRVVESVGDSREEAVRIALEDLNLHCTDHAPDPDCEGCRIQLRGLIES